MSKIFTITEGLENMGALRTGGQGSVYKARRMGPIITAVKILPTPIYTESETDRNFRIFQNEVEKLKKVNEQPNPNVVKILNSGLTESGSFPFIEMEYIEGLDLEELLKPPYEKIFTLKEAIKVADQLANALAHCHKVAVKHGDIKSNNVKFNVNTGNYVLLDFGLSVMSDEQRRTSLRQAGAIEFMAPEQNEGHILFQTDVYSYGIILFELLAGQVPFPLNDHGESSRNKVMIAHMEKPVPDLLALRKSNMPQSWAAEQQDREMQVPQWLLKLINKCLEKSPENRFSNGLHLQEAIIRGSITSIKNDEPFVSPLMNEAVVPSSDPQKGMVLVSKTVFGCLIFLMLLFMAFSVYSLFYKDQFNTPGAYTQQDTSKTHDTIKTTQQPDSVQHGNVIRQERKPVDTPVSPLYRPPVKIAPPVNNEQPPAKDTINNDSGKDTSTVEPVHK